MFAGQLFPLRIPVDFFIFFYLCVWGVWGGGGGIPQVKDLRWLESMGNALQFPFTVSAWERVVEFQ